MPYMLPVDKRVTAMPTLTVTAKGQVTLRKDVLLHLGVGAGDRIEVELLPNGRIEVQAARPAGDIRDVFGLLRDADGPHLSIDEMNAVIGEAWAGKR